MEQARYWMWARKKLSTSTKSSLQSSYGDSWEEQAFAEDSAAALGGCVWPPRSYSCSFCRREFRSAQALGGHMNVHRRDRARLKQSPNTHILENHDNQNLPCTTTPLVGHIEYPPQVCTSLLYNNLIPNTNLTSPSKLSSAPSTQENSSEQTLLVCPCNPSSKSLELRKDDPFSPLIPSLPAHFSKLQRENYPKVGEMGCQLQRDYYVRPDSAVQPKDSTMCWSLQQQPHSGGEDEELISSAKRRRKDVSLSAPIIKHSIPSEKNRNDASLPFFMNLGTPVERINHPQSEVLGLSLGPVDDLDLELRLGNRPKVK